MKKISKKGRAVAKVSEMRAEYDFSGGVRGKHAARYSKGTNVIVLDPDVAKEFPDSESVNSTLRALLPILARRVRRTRRTAKAS
ncbi:MAG: hypothetical protein IT349_15840 [Candidatus Eisenbacteria bacterium]|nr:hypothetical protein [Candidatus Eisenbacteria bacterium]MCC7143571.1 hypothetical protein [Candidatus Eisenbacteria bacterium]